MAKNRITKILTMKQLRNFIGTSSAVRKFADSHNIVYFGAVGQDDGSRLIKGITVSNTYRDMHYMVGSDFGRDLTFVQRTDNIRSALNRKLENYTWNIMAFDLSPKIRLPHIYMEGRARHGRGFYEMLSMKYRELVEIPVGFLPGYDPLFMKKFCVRLNAGSAVELPALITPDRAAILAHHFALFDIEFREDTFYIYYLSTRPGVSQLELMLKCGIWLANEIEGTYTNAWQAYPQQQQISAQQGAYPNI